MRLKTAAKAVAVCVIAGGVIALMAENQEKIAASPEGECASPVTAYVMTQDAVRARLAAPAEFPRYTDPAVDVSAFGECSFLVRAYVETANARSTYLADVTHDPEAGTWSVSDVRVSD